MRNPLRRDTAAALRRATDDLAAVESRIAELQQERASKLLDAALGELAELDRRLADQGRAAIVFRDRVAALESRQVAEREEQDRRNYQAEVDKKVARLARRLAAARAVARSLENLADHTKEFIFASDAAGLEALDLAELLRSTFNPDRGLMGRRHPPDYLKLACDAGGHGFVAAVQDEHAKFEHYLRHANDAIPEPVEDDFESEDEQNAENAA